jgi:leucine-zipper-like transcriptional regulator 1
MIGVCWTSALLVALTGQSASSNPGHHWGQALPPGSGAFQETWAPGKFPLALKPVPGPGNRLWMVGGRGVWSSADGLSWERATAELPWGDRAGGVTVFFRGELWTLGGEERGVKNNEVFHSPDGTQWTAAPSPPWSPRRWHSAIVYRDKLWVLGGLDTRTRSDVWQTADGVTWRQVSVQAPWSPRAGHVALVWRQQLCVVGGGLGSQGLNDVWCSSDGVSWSRLTGRAGWSARAFPGVAVLDDRLWVFGGSAAGVAGNAAWLNDVWTSRDGVRWERHAEPAPWSPRAPEYNAVFLGRLWVFGGKGLSASGAGGFADDTWTLNRSP